MPCGVDRVPEVACDLRRPGEAALTGTALAVLTLAGDEVKAITTSFGAQFVAQPGLPPTLPG